MVGNQEEQHRLGASPAIAGLAASMLIRCIAGNKSFCAGGGAGLNHFWKEDAVSPVKPYLPPIFEVLSKFLFGQLRATQVQDEQWVSSCLCVQTRTELTKTAVTWGKSVLCCHNLQLCHCRVAEVER